MKKVCFYILLLLTGCSVQHPFADAIATLFAEYKIDDYNYSIMDTNGVIQKSDYIEKTTIGYEWADSFILPIILTREIENDHINEDSLLCQYISVRDIHRDLLLGDIIRIAENCPDLFPQNSDDALSYMRRLVRARFQDVYSRFCEDELKIKGNHLWDTKTLLTITKRISFIFDSQNVTGYLPVGSRIPDMYPTWFVENIYQLAGWYTFRINKHVVLWNSVSDDKHTVLCIKFVDMQRMVTVIWPYNVEFLPFDSKGNPDLLLSPLALAILRENFEPDADRIDYNGKKEELCSQLLKKKGSPYLSLYIKELQAHIRHTQKVGDQVNELKLKDVYSILFPYSLSLDYLSKAPLSAIHYVSDRMSASRYFTLDKETSVAIFSSNQCRKYMSKNKIENDSVIVADKCWIENVVTKEMVWSPKISTHPSMQVIRAERCDTILPPGNYLIHYDSDGKHSFESWLSSAPLIDDYGIRIYKK